MPSRIEISTAHNIIVFYDLATLVDRIMALFIDLIVVFVIASFLIGIGNSIGLSSTFELIAFFIFTFYHLLFEIFNGGQSPGKRLVQIKVVNLKGIPPNPSEALQRWVFRILDITFSLGALASLFITSSPRNQRLGDIIAGCTVIKIKKNSDVSLDRINRIQEKERVIQFPKVKRYSDQDMLLIKEALLRHKKFNNKSSRQVLFLLSEKIKDDMGVSIIGFRPEVFLEEVLKDYVSLTR